MTTGRKRKIEFAAGYQVNELTVIREVDKDAGERRQYECQCSCGNITLVPASRLNTRKAVSCGKCTYIRRRTSKYKRIRKE